MTLVLDASVAIKWVIDEHGGDAAEAVIGEALLAPDLFQVEVAHVLTKRVRQGQLSANQAREGIALILKRVELISMRRLGPAALDLSLELRHSVHDCYYFETATYLDLPLLTADRLFVRKLRATGRGAFVRLLGEGDVR